MTFEVGVNQILWTNLFLDAQGYKVKDTIIYRDNQSAMKLEMNRKASSGKRTRHLNIRYFFLTDQIEQGKVSIKYCPTDAMTSDYMTKPFQFHCALIVSVDNSVFHFVALHI